MQRSRSENWGKVEFYSIVFSPLHLAYTQPKNSAYAYSRYFLRSYVKHTGTKEIGSRAADI